MANESTSEPVDYATLQQAYKTAVEHWIAAIREEEALASVHPSVAQVDTWEHAHFAEEDARDMDAMLGQGYHGSRYSFGYPACPKLEDQEPIFKLLDAGRIGVALSDEFQIHPEQSTSALIVHHPKAKYFSV